MNSARTVWGLRIGLSAATAALILVGASLNASGRVGWSTALACLAGLIAMAALPSNTARQGGADVACCSRATGDLNQFVPQTPGVGLEGLHPLAVTRQANGAGPLLAAVESGTTFSAAGNGALKGLFNHLPEDVRIVDAVAVPMPIGDRIGGFILLGSRRVRFSEDDRRLATTLTIRAGSQLAGAHAVALSQKESARYPGMNELVQEPSGKTMQEALEVV